MLVLIGHTVNFQLLAGAASTGVTLFFVLSGFLITALLAQEWRDTGRIDLRAFYRRRALRLLPALCLLLLVVFVLMKLAPGWLATDRIPDPTTPFDVLATILYFANM